MKIINSAKALIVKDEKLLLLKIQDKTTYYVLPGGSQKPGELLSTTVKRECLEETGFLIKPKDIIFICEGFREGFQRVDITFSCEYLKSGQPLQPDEYQAEICWLTREELQNVTFYPVPLKQMLIRQLTEPRVYLGVDHD